MKVVFLHIPKTAGQSVHQFLIDAFGQKNIAPARVNEQLLTQSISNLNKYLVFSGHLDWSLLDCINGRKFVFTILRKPEDRILSFYFYLRERAKKLAPKELTDPSNQGMRAAIELSPDEYFTCRNLGIRTFLDNHYDNFYTYYFAGRTYDGRQKISSKIGSNKGFESMSDVVNLAIANMKSIDKIYGLNSWTKLYDDLKNVTKELDVLQDVYYVNKGNSLSLEGRYQELERLGATSLTFDKIKDFCCYDNVIYGHYCQ